MFNYIHKSSLVIHFSTIELMLMYSTNTVCWGLSNISTVSFNLCTYHRLVNFGELVHPFSYSSMCIRCFRLSFIVIRFLNLTELTKNFFISGYCFSETANIAVRDGTLDVSMIATNDTCALQFSVYPTTDEPFPHQITGPDCTVDSNLDKLYYVNRSGLIIQNSTTTENGEPISTAGFYMAICKNNGVQTGAKLLVIRK